jgi:23S rRNA pseudouridine1911/1915/1917 synthase
MTTQEPVSQISILREETAWLVVAKPAGVHSVAQRGSDAPSVEAWLRTARPDLAALDEAGLVHRLDHETSGCLLVAKDADTRERLRDAFSGRGGEVRKTYLARVEGRLPERVMAGSFTLSFTSRHKGSAKVTVHTRGEPDTIGRCRWRVRSAAAADAEPSTLLEVELLGPGRRHQIRAGLAHEGHPLVGDTLYGARAAQHGPLLHAWRLVVDGTTVECPPPDWAGAEPNLQSATEVG